MDNELVNYLKELPIPVEDKRYVNNFFSKKEYVDGLNRTMIESLQGEVLQSSIGNYNAKIAIVLEDCKDIEAIKKFMTPLLESINTSIWNLYTTFLKKGSIDTPYYQDMLYFEIQAISPSRILFFSSKPSFSDELLYNISTTNINIDDIRYSLDKDNQTTERYSLFLNGMRKLIASLIPYREIEIEE